MPSRRRAYACARTALVLCGGGAHIRPAFGSESVTLDVAFFTSENPSVKCVSELDAYTTRKKRRRRKRGKKRACITTRVLCIVTDGSVLSLSAEVVVCVRTPRRAVIDEPRGPRRLDSGASAARRRADPSVTRIERCTLEGESATI